MPFLQTRPPSCKRAAACAALLGALLCALLIPMPAAAQPAPRKTTRAKAAQARPGKAAPARKGPAKTAPAKKTTAQAAPVQAVDPNVTARVAAAGKAHPRLFLAQGQEEALKAKIDGEPLLKGVFGQIAQASDEMMALPPVVYKKEGRRLLEQSRTALRRMSHLAFMARLTGEPRYVARAQKEMLAAAAFTDWNPSHFLDVAEMTAAMAIGYDWLYDRLDPGARATIRKAIVEKGLKTSFTSRWPVTATNNWGQVCHGGLVMGAVAVLDDEPALAAQVIDRALKNVHFSTDAYKPDGTYPEGPGYWGYGTSFNVLLIEALATGLGTDFGLSQAQGFMQTADYYLHAHGPTGDSFNYSDCGVGGGVEPAMFWFAAQLKQPNLLWQQQRELQQDLRRRVRGAGSDDRLLPFLLIWTAPLKGIEKPAELHRQGQGETAIAMHRTGWDENATYIALKGGSPSASHGHMDIGSFVMEADGVRWATDLGMQSYNSIESRGMSLWDFKQDGQRWTIFRLNNFSHGTLVVDGKLQNIAGFAKITRFAPGGAMPHSVLDMTPVYAGQLAEAQRGLALLGGKAALVQDELKALDHDTEVRWAMLTGAQADLQGDRALLTSNGKRLELRVLEPANAKLEIYPTNPPPADYDAKNPGTQLVGFKVKMAATAKRRIVVLLTPGPASGKAPEIKPLAEWQDQ